MRSKVDDALLAALTRNWQKRIANNYLKTLQKNEEATPRHIHEVLHRIDTKGTALVTYVAMIIAGLGICAPLVAQHPFEEAIVIAQISVFLLIAVGCLRCLSVFSTPGVSDEPAARLRHLERELIVRQELFRICHRASIVFTLGVFVSLPIMLLWRPGN
jgi:hypothetical protein